MVANNDFHKARENSLAVDCFYVDDLISYRIGTGVGADKQGLANRGPLGYGII